MSWVIFHRGHDFMGCRQKKKVVPYLRDELESDEREQFQSHWKTCASCRESVESLKSLDQLLKARPLPEAPEGLAEACIRRVDEIDSVTPKSSRWSRLLERWNVLPAPAFRFAMMTIVFLAGLGMGKLLFDKPSWTSKFGGFTEGSPGMEMTTGRPLRNYLLSVETLFLDFSNMESAALDAEDWEAELEMTQEVLKRTRELKRLTESINPQLYQLVAEIEWVLEEIAGTPQMYLADVSRDVRQTIDEQRILVKIHGYI